MYIYAPAAAAAKTHSYFSIAINPDYVGYWVVTGQKKSAAASDAALALCNKASSGRCETAMTASAGHVVIGYGIDGALNFTARATAEVAIQAFEAQCIQTYHRPCTTETSFDVTMKRRFQSPLERRKFAALAGEFEAADPAKRDPRLWFAGGQPSWADAIAKAMNGCVAALGEKACKHVTTSGQTHIALYRDVEGTTGGFLINLTRQAVVDDVKVECASAGVICELVDVSTAKDEIVKEYDLLNMRAMLVD